MFSFVSYALFAVIEGLFATWEATLYFGVLWFDQFHVYIYTVSMVLIINFSS